jgi:hypothetical protein
MKELRPATGRGLAETIVEEPGEIAFGGLLDGFLEGLFVAVWRGIERGVDGERVTPRGERLAEELITQQIAKLPEDEAGFQSQEDVGWGLRQGLRVGFGQGDDGGGLAQLADGLVPALGALGPDEGGELGQAFADPQTGGRDGARLLTEPGTGESADEFGRDQLGVGGSGELGGEEAGVFKGLARMVQEQERGARAGAEERGQDRVEAFDRGDVGVGDVGYGADDGE